jgi:DNA-binding transcriptional MerR regulator
MRTALAHDRSPALEWNGRDRELPEPDRRSFTIAQLSKEFGVSLRTLRFYEARRFVAPRRDGAARFYSQSDRDRIALILRAKRLGFTLREIGDLMAQGDAETGRNVLRLSRQQCTDQIGLLERQKREIETALSELRRIYSSHYLRGIERGDFDEV